MVLRPQVLTKENVLTSYVQPAGDRTIAMIGSAKWGPVNEVVAITSMSEFVSTFGDDDDTLTLTLVKGVDLALKNGGQLKVIRIEDGDAAKSTYTAVNGVTNVITFSGYYKGTAGDDITVTITANPTTAGNRDLVITNGIVTEYYNNASAGYDSNLAIVTAINAKSVLVTAEVLGGYTITNLVDAKTATQLSGGDNGENSLASSDYTTAMDNLLLTESFNFLTIPGMTNNSFHITVNAWLEARATNENRYSRFLTGVAKDETIATATARTVSGKRTSLCYPNIFYTNRITDVQGIIDGSYLACAYAGKLCNLDIQVSGTHETINVEDLSMLESTGKKYLNKVEQEQLLEGRILPFALIGNSIQAVRGVTRESSTTSVYFDEVVVDIVDESRTRIETLLEVFIGKPNNSRNRLVVESQCDALLNVLLRQEIIQEFINTTATEGSSVDTMIVTIGIKPTYNTNFIDLTLNIN